MPLEKKVCSLELANELKSLGVPQESLFAHIIKPDMSREIIINRSISADEVLGFDFIVSAFNCSELGEMLPDYTVSVHAPSKYPNAPSHLRMPWVCNIADGSHQETADTEADARAKMLIHLLKQGLIKNDK